jgi:hypothetical protein
MNNKLKYFLLVATTAAAIGAVYTLSTFMNLPEDFDWEADDE